MNGIADYEFVRPLGAGRHGRVFLARCPPRLTVEVEHVAVKVLNGTTGAEGFQRASRVLRAVVAAASPYLVTLYDVGQHDGIVYYAMQHLADGSLAAPARPLDQAAMVRSVADVARAAGALHAVGIVHRAIKPGNTLLTSYGAKLSDVDLSHAVTPGLVMPGLATPGLATPGLATPGLATPGLATPGMVVPGMVVPGLATTTGSPVAELELVDPDVLRGEPPAPRHDVWSVGAMLHRVVAGIGIYGELPAADGLGTVWSIMSAKPEISSALPGPIAEIVGDCLARGAQRPPATVVADQLAAAG